MAAASPCLARLANALAIIYKLLKQRDIFVINNVCLRLRTKYADFLFATTHNGWRANIASHDWLFPLSFLGFGAYSITSLGSGVKYLFAKRFCFSDNL